MLRRADLQTTLHGKDALPKAGEYTVEVLIAGLATFLPRRARPGSTSRRVAATAGASRARSRAPPPRSATLPARPPTFCIGCPERPVFCALKLLQRDIGPTHIAADIGCHAFATFEPFSMGNSILGYGMSLASAAGVAPNCRGGRSR